MRSYLDGLFRYSEFSGRTGRAQYWLFHFWTYGILLAAAAIEIKLTGWPPHYQLPPYVSLLCLFHTLPMLAVLVRRLHDTGHSGWWYWLGFVPFGGFVIFYWTLLPSDDWDNDYGDPNAFNRAPRTQQTGRGRAGAIPAARLAIATGRRSTDGESYRLRPSEGRFI